MIKKNLKIKTIYKDDCFLVKCKTLIRIRTKSRKKNNKTIHKK